MAARTAATHLRIKPVIRSHHWSKSGIVAVCVFNSRTPLVFLILVTLRTANFQSNSTPTVAEPQYLNSFSAFDSTGKLIELEHQTVTTFHSKMKPLPAYASVKVLAEFKPGHSSVRLPTGARFAVRGRSIH